MESIISTKFFFDTEFIEDGKTIDLISIGIVREDGKELYLGNSECQFSKASNWVRENVLSKLDGLQLNLNYLAHDCDRDFWKTRSQIAQDIVNFVGGETKIENLQAKNGGKVRGINVKYSVKKKPEFWAYYADYDWVVFCQLFGTMMDLPKGFPMYCRDIKQECDRLGNPELPPQSDEHSAIADARWDKEAWEFLKRFDVMNNGALHNAKQN